MEYFYEKCKNFALAGGLVAVLSMQACAPAIIGGLFYMAGKETEAESRVRAAELTRAQAMPRFEPTWTGEPEKFYEAYISNPFGTNKGILSIYEEGLQFVTDDSSAGFSILYDSIIDVNEVERQSASMGRSLHIYSSSGKKIIVKEDMDYLRDDGFY